MKNTAALRVTGMARGRSVRRVPAIVLTSSGGKVYVAAKGRPYLLRYERADHRYAMDYDHWNTKITIVAPTTSLHATV